MAQPAATQDPPATEPRLHAPGLMTSEVFADELEQIAQSRERRGFADTALKELKDTCEALRRKEEKTKAAEKQKKLFCLGGSCEPGRTLPQVGLGLCGLALSGGGIRSATFCLGVLQALAEAGKLRFIDYLSTVSGGGYIGCSWSALLARISPACSANELRSVAPPDFPFVHMPRHDYACYPDRSPVRKPDNYAEGERYRSNEEPVAVEHVRDFANYLMPRGIVDQIRIPALLLRGLIVNLTLVLPYILLAACLFLACLGWRWPVPEGKVLNSILPLLAVYAGRTPRAVQFSGLGRPWARRWSRLRALV